MRIRTDDEIYRVDAVWLGPPKATFPWRARYVAWGVGIPVFLIILGIERQLGIGFGFFSTAWAFVLTIAITRLITSKISHERPLSAVFTMWVRELQTPRERNRATGGAASASKIKVRTERPLPKNKRRGNASVAYGATGPAQGAGDRAGLARTSRTAPPQGHPAADSTARAHRRTGHSSAVPASVGR
ncbi:hypothetical protein BJF85_22590 [Saccharomonospora sp. CUA-673]|uniref:hypothetical protein n=1 Tax=Saccharomonospora sp. CUA-673 TaxID=1904969 RepID=UPI0009611C60|nr:hypothetical protein [Saccharomonospora sp. CUA-673]OLT42511.1 hypothetical protein BJF85_22590 [Saccharomonospora sp. CUA-673]